MRLRPWFDNESVGDVTGDGIDDLMIRSTNVEVFAGRSTGLPDINPVATLDTPLYPGNAVSPGDIDADGIRDVLVATRTSSAYRTPYPGYTTVIAFRGAPQNMFAKPLATLTGRRNGGDFPQFIAGPGIR